MYGATGAPVVLKVPGQPDREIPLLSLESFERVAKRMPLESEDGWLYVKVAQIHAWAGTPGGAVQVLSVASGETPEQVRSWASLRALTGAATAVVLQSFFDGDPPAPEDETPAEGKKRSDPSNGRMNSTGQKL